MPLLDRPPELLTLIAQHLGTSELRQSVAYLLVAKRWYCAVLPVYLSHLPLKDLYLASHRDLEILPSSGTTLGHEVQVNTRRLSVRLVGHPCKYPGVAPFHNSEEVERGADGMKKVQYWHCDWMTVGPEKSPGSHHLWRWRGETLTLHRWAGRINRKLVELAALLPNSSMEEFSLEAASEDDGEKGPRWDYLHDSTIRSLISSFPPCLNNLTIDLCGSRLITPDRGREPAHMCPLIGDRLRDFQNARLRLRCICPQVFQSSASNPATQSKLKTLVIKLNLPFFPIAVDEHDKGNKSFDAKPYDLSAVPLYKRMIAAGAKSTSYFPGLHMMRISYRKDKKSNICLNVADCVRKQILFDGNEMFCYEDDGSQWLAWEDDDNLQVAGSLQDLLR